MHIKNMANFISGLIFLVVGIGFGIGATSYEIGSAAHMGPGYFPLLCGILLATIGIIVCVQALTFPAPDGEAIGALALRPLVLITAANMLFGILLAGSPLLRIPAFGIIVATPVLIIVAARAGRQFKLWEAILLGLILTLGTWLAFVRGLNMPFQVWPDFLLS